MWFSSFALRRPYTIAAVTALVCLFGVFSARRMPTDIFPEINIPVVSVVWSYNGMVAREIQTRIIDQHERQLASLVDDIERLESNSYNGVGVIKVYLHEGASTSAAVSQITSSALTVLKYMPRNITPPLVVRYSATDVPVIQLSLASETLPDVKLNDYGQNVIRPFLATVQGAQVPFPYGGKPRLIMADLDNDALRAKNLTPNDVTEALLRQNLILPTGTAKVGDIEYAIELNNSTDAIEAMNDFPVKRVGGAMVFLRDVAHVHSGYQVQTNSVAVDGAPGSLMIIRKTGGESTLRVIDGILAALPDVRLLLPEGMTIKPIFNQAVFVNAALRSVQMGGLMAAVAHRPDDPALPRQWAAHPDHPRLHPALGPDGRHRHVRHRRTFNVMTLGGFALAVGILVDNATVVIENVERHLSLGNDLEEAIVQGAGEVGFPTMVSTLSICIVFVPIFLLQGTSRYLFSPLAVAVIASLLASLLISFTLVPLLFKLLMKRYAKRGSHADGQANAYVPSDHAFNRHFQEFRRAYRHVVAWGAHHPIVCGLMFVIAAGVSWLLFPILGMDFFPQVDAGQMRLHVRAPNGTRLEKTQELFGHVEAAIREIVGRDEVDVMLDNIGLPYSGINIALSDTATAGPMDGEILISLVKDHRPTAGHIAALRRELPGRFPEMRFFFQPADIVNQVLNFGQPSPIDIRVTGAKEVENYKVALKIQSDFTASPAWWTFTCTRSPSRPPSASPWTASWRSRPT